MAKILTVYFSRKGENYWKGAVRDLEKGNTEIAAEFVQKAVGRALFEVQTTEDYPAEYRACCAQAARELREDARPALKALPAEAKECDVLFLGYPNWCGTMPMALFTFLESFDASGKTIAPFCTNEGSGMGRSEADIAKLCPGARVAKGLSVRGCEAAQSEARIAEWAKANL